jgi:hypothetical protein
VKNIKFEKNPKKYERFVRKKPLPFEECIFADILAVPFLKITGEIPKNKLT